MRRALAAAVIVLSVAAGPAPAQLPDPSSLDVRSRLHLAITYQQERRFEEAADLYRDVLESAPAELRARRGLKACLLELKSYDELVEMLNEELASVPGDPAALTELGTVYARKGDRDAAYRTWRRILAVQEGSRGAYSTVAELLARNRMLDEALWVYAEGDSAHPGRFTRQRAELFELRFDFPAATAEYLRFLEDNPTALSYVEGRLLRIGENEDGLRPVIDRVEGWVSRWADDDGTAGAEHVGSNELQFRKLLGDLYLEAGDHDQAGEHYFRLATDSPGQFASLLAFGKRCQTDGEHAVAIRVFRRIVSDFPGARVVPGALTEIGRSEQSLERWDDALATYGRLVEEYPETDYALAARLETGRVLREGKRDPAAAEAVFRDLIRLGAGPWGEAEPQFQVAECAVWREDLETARGIYQAVRARNFSDPTREKALYEEARAALYAGNTAEADSLFKQVAQQYRKGLLVNDALQLSILVNTNQGEEALATYGKALLDLRRREAPAAVIRLDALLSQSAGEAIVDDALLLLGRAHREAGDPDRALAALQRAVGEAQVGDLAAAARLMRAEILADEKNDHAAALAEYEELLVAYPETLSADRARELAGTLKRVLP
ncbi:MAG TPA: tetratricopeptide repeat protein [bacterium]|nr:tetratricopeptide repeat protein [bacterium]